MKKLVIISALTIVAVAGVAAGTVSALATTVTTQSAAAKTLPLKIEPMGDSVTCGNQSSTGNGYRGPLHDDLTGAGHAVDFVGSARNGTMSDPDNEGHAGWRIDQLAGITDSSMATYKPDVVLLMAGTNDLGQNYQVSTAPARLGGLVDKILRDDPKATVLVASLITSMNTVVAPLRPAYNTAVADMVSTKKAAGEHVALADMSAVTTADMFDALHPNDNGYKKMAVAWNKSIEAAAASGWITLGSGDAPVAVVSGIAGKCLDVKGGSDTNGTRVEIWGCNRTDAQSWTANADGTLRAVGKCLDVTNNGTANGAKLELWDCNGGSNQQWQPTGVGYRNPASGRCLDDPGWNASDGTQLDIWDCDSGANQQWTPSPF